MQTYGLPLQYYVDNLRVFRFVQAGGPGADSNWRKHVLETDDVDPQWRQVMRLLGLMSSMLYRLKPKGKLNAPIGGCKIVSFAPVPWNTSPPLTMGAPSCKDVQLNVLQQPPGSFHHGRDPSLRFANARTAGSNLFRPFSLPKPYASLKDVFCLRETRVVNGYRRVSLFNHEIEVPNVPLREEVEIHLTPNAAKQVMDVRIWWSQKMVHSVSLPLAGLRVHF